MYAGIALRPERRSVSGHGKLPSVAPLSSWLVSHCHILSPKCRALASACRTHLLDGGWQAIFLLQGRNLVPGLILNIDAFTPTLLRGAIFQLAGIEHFRKPGSRWRRLEVVDKLGDIPLELL